MIYILIFGFIISLIVVIAEISSVKKQVKRLLDEVIRLQGLGDRISRLEKDRGLKGPAIQEPGEIPKSPAVTPSVVTPPPPRPFVPEERFAKPESDTTPPQPVQTFPASKPIIPIEPPAPSKSREEWEAFVGGKLLNRIGAFALIIGVGFFLKYAFDNNWISETVRVLIGTFAGLLCLVIAYRTNRRGLNIFAQGLVGSGIAILYLSVYASFNFYHIVPQWIAMILMSAVTAIAFGHGIFYGSIAVGILGWAGGFLTPFMLSTGQSNEVALFSYIAMLDLAILAILIRKNEWIVLEPLAILATWITYYLWHARYYSEDKLITVLLFITVFWLLFHVRDLLRHRTPVELHREIKHLLPLMNVALFYVTLYIIMDENYHAWLAAVSLALGAFYVGSFLVLGNVREGVDVYRPQYILTASVLLGFATAIYYSGYTIAILWAAESAVILWFATREDFRFLRHIGLAFLVAAGLRIATFGNTFGYQPIEVFIPVLNIRALTFLIYTVMLAAGSRFQKQHSDRFSLVSVSWLQAAAATSFFIALTVEVVDFFSLRQATQPAGVNYPYMFSRLMVLSVAWIVYSLPLVWSGLRVRNNTVVVSGLIALLLSVTLAAIRGIAYSPIEIFPPILNIRTVALFIVLIITAVQLMQIIRYSGTIEWVPEMRPYLTMAIGVLFFSLLTGETRDYFGRMLADLGYTGGKGSASDDVVKILNLQQLCLSGIWLVYSVILMTAGIWRKSRILRIFSMVLFGITILKIFLYDLSFLETLYRIFSFIGLGLILLGVSYAYQRYKDILFGNIGGTQT